MAINHVVAIQSVVVDLQHDKMTVRINVLNAGARTFYAYGSPRRLLYDGASQTLTLLLHDRHLESEAARTRHVPHPKFVSLNGNSETEIEISLPNVVKRLRSAMERAGSGPLVEEWRISDATQITVEMAYQDTPYYHNPQQDSAKQLMEWGQAIATGSWSPH